ncbi:O-antigen ligase family protein [Coprothermobacteraceae bacterium]|nr:O-antigen ligase family protein [Coprothermobacteraceae bacterium]
MNQKPKIRELRQFENLLLYHLPWVVLASITIVVPANWLKTWGVAYAFVGPAVVALVISKQTWSSFTVPKAHALIGVSLWGAAIVVRSFSSLAVSWPVILYASWLLVHPLFKGMPAALGSSERATGAWVRLAAVFVAVVVWNVASPLPFDMKLWILAMPPLAVCVSIVMASRNKFYVSGKQSFGREFGSMGNPMAASSLLVLALPVFAELAFVGIASGRYWMLTALPLYAYGLVSSAGRATVAGVLLAMPFIAYRSVQYSPWWLAVFMGLIFIVLLWKKRYASQLLLRVIHTIKRGITKEPRFYLWRDALRYYVHNPVGAGYDQFRRAFMPYRSRESYLAEPPVHYDKVHNLFIEELTEGSAVGFVLLIASLALWFLTGPLVLKASLVAFIGDGLFTIYDAANWVYLWSFGILAPQPLTVPLWAWAPIVAVLLMGYIMSALNLSAQTLATGAVAARHRGERDVAAQLFNAAYSIYPYGVEYISECYLLQLGTLHQARLSSEQAQSFHESLKVLEPYIYKYAPNVDDIYGQWLVFVGNYPSLRNEAERLSGILLGLNPYGYKVRKALAHYLGNAGKWDMAMSYLEQNVAEYPFDADSYYMLVMALVRNGLTGMAKRYLTLWMERFPEDKRWLDYKAALGL